MIPIVIPFVPNSAGRVRLEADVLKADRLSHGKVEFKLDSGSDFTIISYGDLRDLGYSDERLKECPVYSEGNISTADNTIVTLRYLSNMSIKFGDREIQGCKLFFKLGAGMRSLFGNDILKYFNREINYDTGVLRLTERKDTPALSDGEMPIQIYSVERRASLLDKFTTIKKMELF